MITAAPPRGQENSRRGVAFRSRFGYASCVSSGQDSWGHTSRTVPSAHFASMPALALGTDPPVQPDSRLLRAPHLATYVPPRADTDSAPLVLVAEDHEDSRDALTTLLTALGYRVAVASNGAEAVERARATRPDLILMDMMMPQVDGFQATRTLRQDAAFAGTPIIAITAMEGARDAVREAGCDDLVVKPIDIRAVLERIPAWLASRAS